MAESTLALSKTELDAEVGWFLGYGRGVNFGGIAWTAKQQTNIDACVKSGLRMVYKCGYDWSWLKPVSDLLLASGASTISLPDDFGNVSGNVTIVSASNWYEPVRIYGIGRVNEEFARYPAQTGIPAMGAVVPLKGTGAARGQRWELKVFPTADADYTLEMQYELAANALDAARPFPYGGMAHAETIKAACLAAAELDLDSEIGPRDQKFKELLALSIEQDRKLKAPTVGYNFDRSDDLHVGRGTRNPVRVTYNGLPY